MDGISREDWKFTFQNFDEEIFDQKFKELTQKYYNLKCNNASSIGDKDRLRKIGNALDKKYWIISLGHIHSAADEEKRFRDYFGILIYLRNG